MISAYIHIPFCEQLCYYCDFNKVFLKNQPVDQYIDSLGKEMNLMKRKTGENELKTVYIGGGTPTSLDARQLERLCSEICNQFHLVDGAEWTVEANPGDLTEEKLSILKQYGVNRISMGVQSFDDQLLKKIGRNHTSDDVYHTVRQIEKSGFENVTIDLMYALPGQSFEQWMDSVTQAVSLGLPHLSMYSLILENKTVFANLARQGKLMLPTDEEEVRMFESSKEYLARYGLLQYEISNFSRPGFESQHNLMYWNNEHYFGFGAGASGYLGSWRYRNKGPIQHYIDDVECQRLPIIEEEHLTIHNQMEEHLFLGLRKIQGVTNESFENKFGISLWDTYGNVIDELTEKQLILTDNKGIRLTDKGLLFGNDVFASFLMDD